MDRRPLAEETDLDDLVDGWRLRTERVECVLGAIECETRLAASSRVTRVTTTERE